MCSGMARRKATDAELDHLQAVKMRPCSRCGTRFPSDAHHVRLGTSYKNHWATIPLCRPCHVYVGAHGKETHDLEERLLRETLVDMYPGESLSKLLVRAGR